MRISSSIQQVFVYAVLLLLLALLINMAWPRLLASLQFLPVQQAQSRIYDSRAAETIDQKQLIVRSERAVFYHDAYNYHSALSLLHYLQAIADDASLFDRREALDRSVAEARQSLTGAPLQPDLWLRMAQAGGQSFASPDALIRYFRMAIWSGRVEPTHLIARLQIGFALQNRLDEDDLNLLRDQVLLAWNLKQHDFRSAIRSRRLNYPKIVSLMTETHPDVVREMEEIIGPAAL